MTEELDGIPTLPLEDLCDRVLIDGERRAVEDPTLPRLWTHRELLRTRLRETNLEFSSARNRDDVAAAKARKRLIESDLDKIRTGARQQAVHAMRQQRYIGLGYLNDRFVCIRPVDWTGTVDWDAATLTSGDRIYSGICMVGGPLTSEQEALLARRFAAATAKPDGVPVGGDRGASAEKRPPGQPSSQSLVMKEYRRRQAAGELEPTLTKESVSLSDWLEAQHPHQPSMSANTVGRHIGPHYWQDTGRQPPNSRK